MSALKKNNISHAIKYYFIHLYRERYIRKRLISNSEQYGLRINLV